MYSYTETGVHLIQPLKDTHAQLLIRCQCQRTFIQEQIYTCLACSKYCCHYCSSPEILTSQCRNCCKTYQGSKNSRCQTCFECPYCSNVLVIIKDPKQKLYILLCQFCYWNSKDIKIKQQKAQNLISSIKKISENFKQTDLKIYMNAQMFFKEYNTNIQAQIHKQKLNSNFARIQASGLLDTSINSQIIQIQRIEKNLQSMIHHTTLNETSQQYYRNQKYPQGLILSVKFTRRCLYCDRALTTMSRMKTNQQKIQLVHKNLKILQCQQIAVVDGKVKVRFIREEGQFQNQLIKMKEVREVKINEDFEVGVLVENKTKQTTSIVKYIFVAVMAGTDK